MCVYVRERKKETCKAWERGKRSKQVSRLEVAAILRSTLACPSECVCEWQTVSWEQLEALITASTDTWWHTRRAKTIKNKKRISQSAPNTRFFHHPIFLSHLPAHFPHLPFYYNLVYLRCVLHSPRAPLSESQSLWFLHIHLFQHDCQCVAFPSTHYTCPTHSEKAVLMKAPYVTRPVW